MESIIIIIIIITTVNSAVLQHSTLAAGYARSHREVCRRLFFVNSIFGRVRKVVKSDH